MCARENVLYVGTRTCWFSVAAGLERLEVFYNHLVMWMGGMDAQVRTTGSLSRRGNQSNRWCLQFKTWKLKPWPSKDPVCPRKKQGIHGIPWDTIQLWKSHHVQLPVRQLWIYDVIMTCYSTVHAGGNWRCWKFSLVRLPSVNWWPLELPPFPQLLPPWDRQ